MPVNLTATSLKRLDGVHPHLVAVVKRAAEISDLQFQVTEGLRSLNRQRAMVAQGASRTMKSRHLAAPNGLGHAVDLAVYISGRMSWEPPLYHRLADVVKRAAHEIGIPIEWGGDWHGFFDGPHFQLPWSSYPGVASVADTPPEQPTERELSTLVPGSHGEAVMALQRDLNAAYPAHQLAVDGDFGPATRRAVQSASGALAGRDSDIVTPALREKIAQAAKKAARKG